MNKIFGWLLERYNSLNMHPSVKNGLIVGLLGIVAAIIIASANILGGSDAEHKVSVGDAGSIAVTGSTRDVTINYQISQDNVAKQAIEALDHRISLTDDRVEVTRQELRLVAQALKELDQRTSGIQKLPDGRTLFGKIISGDPRVIIEQQNAAIKASDDGNLVESLAHSNKAIDAYEQTQKKIETTQLMMATGNLGNENISKLYWLATMTAQSLRKNELAYQYAEKMMQANPTPINKALFATVLFNLGKRQEAAALAQEALVADPENKKIIKINKKISDLVVNNR